MKVKIKLNEIITLLLLFIPGFCLLFNNIILNNYTEKINNLTGIVVVIYSVVALLLARNNLAMITILFVIFVTNYSIVMGVYLFPELRSSFFMQIVNIRVYGIGITTILIFIVTTVLHLYLSGEKSELKVNYVEGSAKDTILIIAILLVLGFIFIYGYTQSKDGLRGVGTTYYEYSVILFILGYFYSHHSRLLERFWFFLVIIFMLQSFVNGNRSDGIPFALSYYLYYYSHKFSKPKLALYLAVGFILMIGIGTFRANFSLTWDNLQMVISRLSKEKLTFDTAINAYVPTVSIIDITDNLDVATKWTYFKNTLYYILVGRFAKDYNLVYLAREYHRNIGGCVSTGYFYFWMGYAGCFLFSIFVNLYFKIIRGNYRRSNNNYFRLLSIYLVASVIRWYMYSPLGLLRGVFVFTMIYLLMFCLHKFISMFKRNDINVTEYVN